ncbi:hypothetical protein [Nocardioides marmoribigeumensis]|uniref:Glycosyl hydrolase family 98 putative carbohydrate-binding module domain-containing protein n=1 Tax=Nocardioides marmoribigeumensis TaxID=433649 RepID=A0ABU2C0R9_9ACTN|nr:hypothetical protein [Nocardioides marmoribigeumensis]MDR7364263.1 hypothetical protein [Nocardioides marmoribigeumensis]
MNRPQLPRSVTVLGAVAAAAILVPTAASATGSLVTISDASSSNAARVSTDGRLKTDAGGTELAFRTPAGAVSFPAGTSRLLGKVDVSDYSRIRIMADERAGSASNISFRVTTTEGNELVAQLATFTLTPHSQRTFVVDVPTKVVSIYADAAPGSGNVATDFLVYGSR